MSILRTIRKARAYDRARLAILKTWQTAMRADMRDQYAAGYKDGLDQAVRMIAAELAK